MQSILFYIIKYKIRTYNMYLCTQLEQKDLHTPIYSDLRAAV